MDYENSDQVFFPLKGKNMYPSSTVYQGDCRRLYW